jgi:hypothetical protein
VKERSPCTAVFHDSGGAPQPRRATQTHSLREQHAIVRTLLAFLAITIALYWLLGPASILYALALGAVFPVLNLLTRAFAALLDPAVY